MALQNTIERARMEDCSHFEQLVSFISEMGGEVPLDFREFPRLFVNPQPPLSSPLEQSDERAILRALSEAEKGALQAYLNIYHLTEGKDAHTNRLVSSLLEDETRHRRELLAFLPTGAGHSRKASLVQSPSSALSYGIPDLNLRTFKAGT
ncbi:MAG: ferritin-like domain-containing protein [bacterium]